MDKFASVGIPYLETFSDLNVVLDVFVRDDKEAFLRSPFHHERAMRAIAIAFLLGDRENFQRKTAFLTSRNDVGLPLFIKVRDDLAARLGNE